MNQQIVFDSQLQSQKKLVWWLYLFHGASLVFTLGMFSFIPLILNYVKREDAAGTFVYSHHQWQIRSFWWFFFWLVISGLLFLSIIGFFLGYFVWAAAWIWKAYRIIKGFLDLDANKAMPI